MDLIQQLIERILPDSFDPAQYFMSILIGIISILVVGGVFRLCFGKGSIINCAISSAIAIVCLYIINVVVYSLGSNLSILFKPLPFVTVSGDYLTVFPIFDASFSEICGEFTRMIVLSYLMNMLETWLPKGDKLWSWYCFRALSLILAICLHYCINLFIQTALPEAFGSMAPMILLLILVISIILCFTKLMVGGALSFISPFLGLFYTFFFSKPAGKQLARAIYTTILLTILVCVLNHLSYTSIFIGSVAIITYLPVIIFGLILWYILAKLL